MVLIIAYSENLNNLDIFWQVTIPQPLSPRPLPPTSPATSLKSSQSHGLYLNTSLALQKSNLWHSKTTNSDLNSSLQVTYAAHSKQGDSAVPSHHHRCLLEVVLPGVSLHFLCMCIYNVHD